MNVPNTPIARRDFLSAALIAPVLATEMLHRQLPAAACALDAVRVTSPNKAVKFDLVTGDQQRLSFQAILNDVPIIDSSTLVMIVDGIDVCDGADIQSVDDYRLKETYPWRGVHSQARNHFNGARIALTHKRTGSNYTLDVRAFDDAVAFRFVVPGQGTRVPDEATTFVLRAGSTAWYHGLRGHYEGVYERKDVAEVKAGEWAGPPLTFKLPNGAGYASITEAGINNYAGMALQADGQRGMRVQLGHAHPASYPYTLRYGEESAARLSKPAAVAGTITTPWRVLMVGADLNTLVNCDAVPNLAAAPDAQLFPEGLRTEWIKPGRAVWKYLDGGGPSTLATMKEFSRMASELGFEYNLVEGFWARWPESDLRELIDYSRQRNVGIWLWKHSRDLRTPETRAAFFQHLQNVGAAGAKIDFFDHEAKEVMDVYQAALASAAQHKVMVNFHGANKPAGEARTWPNEMTREGVQGMEHSNMTAWSRHDTTVPFTRMLAGHLEFTPMVFGERRRETSWTHQIANAVMFTSPLLVFGAHPKTMLEHPAAEMIKSIPSVWDETRVLAPSEIGELAAFARRSGKQWFLVITNGPTARSLDVPLSFLGRGAHKALLVRDNMEESASVQIENTSLRGKDTLHIDLRAGGGFIGRFS